MTCRATLPKAEGVSLLNPDSCMIQVLNPKYVEDLRAGKFDKKPKKPKVKKVK